MIIKVEHNPSTQTLTITLPNKVVQLAYQGNLPPGWEADPDNPTYITFIINFLNNLIEERVLKRIWLQGKDLKPNDPLPFTDSERLWYDSGADEVVFMEAIVTGAVWSADRNEYLITVRNTSIDKPRV